MISRYFFFCTFPRILRFRSSTCGFFINPQTTRGAVNEWRTVIQIYLSCGVFSASFSRGVAIQFAESDFRSFETKRRSATRAPAIGLRAMQRGPFVSDAIILSLFDSQFVQIPIKLSRNALYVRLLYIFAVEYARAETRHGGT